MESQKINIYNLVKAVKEIGYSHIPTPLKEDFREFVKITSWGRDFASFDEDKRTLNEVQEIVERFNDSISHLKELKGWPEDQLYKSGGEITRENFSKHEKFIDFDLLPHWVTEWYYRYKYHINFSGSDSEPSDSSGKDSYSPINNSTFIKVENSLNSWNKQFGGLPKRKFKSSGLDGKSGKLEVVHEKLTVYNTFDFYAISKVVDVPFDLNVLHLMVRENTNYGADFSLLISNPIARHAIDMMLNFLTDAADGLEKTAEITGIDLLTGSNSLSVEDVFEYAHRIDTTLIGGELGKQIVQLAYVLENTPIGDHDNYPKDFENAIMGIAKKLGEFILYLGGIPLKQTKTNLEGATKQKYHDPDLLSARILWKAWDLQKEKENVIASAFDLLTNLQDAITGGKIRKADVYAKQIELLQSELIAYLKSPGKNKKIKYSDKLKSLLKQVVDRSDTDSVAVTLKLLSYIYGDSAAKEPARTEIENKLKYVKTSLEKSGVRKGSADYNNLMKAKAVLEKALKENGTVEIPDFELGKITGKKKEEAIDLKGISVKTKSDADDEFLFGIEPTAQTQYPAVMSAEQMAALQIDRLPFTGLLKRVLGQPENGFAFMLYGSPGSGKTIFSLWMSMQLALSFGNVLYVTAEQYPKGSLTTRIQEMKAAGTLGLDFTKRIDNPEVNINLYDFIIIDSVNSHNLSVEQFRELQKQYPQKSFILILQTLKNGNYRGSREWEHDTDIVAKIENREIEISKSRYDTTGSVKIPDLLAKPENQQED